MVFSKYFLFFLLFSSIYADYSATAPPYNDDAQGGMRAPSFSDANAQSIYWLNLVDQKQYRASWGAAANLFRDLIARDFWRAAMEGIRKPLGTVRSRKVTRHEQIQKLRYGTLGYFMIIEYRTQFSNQAYADEKVTLVAEGPLRLWKVLSYDISYR